MMKLVLVTLVLFQAQCLNALMVGRRRIMSTTPVGGNEDVDALLEPRLNIPGIIGFVGAQATIPSLSKCPIANQIQAPWYLGDAEDGSGICPPEFWNWGAVAPGLVLIAGALAINSYINSNRLLVTATGLGTIPESLAVSEAIKEDGFVEFSDIDSYFMSPVGLFTKLKSTSSNKFFPLFWDQKSVEALLENRLP